MPKTNFVDGSEIPELVRIIKTESEIAHLRKTCEITDTVFSEIFEFVKLGRNDVEVSQKLKELFIEKGVMWFNDAEPLVQSGVRGSLLSTLPDKNVIRAGLVVFDMGACVEGYNCDVQRMASIGHPSPDEERAFNKQRELCEEAIQMIKPGLKVSDLHKFAISKAREQGYDFARSVVGPTMWLGHGVGLDTHERPWIGPRDPTILETGMIFAFEPGFILPNFAVRLENIILVTESGHEQLSKFPHDLVIKT